MACGVLHTLSMNDYSTVWFQRSVQWCAVCSDQSGRCMSIRNSQSGPVSLADRTKHVPVAVCAGSEIPFALKPKLR